MRCLLNGSPLATTVPFCFLLLFATACSEQKETPKKENAGERPTSTIVDVMVAQPVSISDTIEANGTVTANESVELHPEVAGRLIYLNVPEGKFVEKGTVLARVNDADLRAQIQKSKVGLQLAEANEQRFAKLLDIQGVNQADYDAIVNQVASLKADIDYANALIEKTVVRAPFSGVIGLRQVSPGAYVTANTVIATLQQTSRIKIDFTVPQEYSNIVKTGNKIEVVLGNANEKAGATVIAIEPQVNQQTRNLKVRALLDEGKSNPGAFVKVYLSSGANKNAILVPTNAIIPGDQSNQLILVKNGKASMTDVQTGMRMEGLAEITSGIAKGDTIIVTGVLFARPNSEVTIRSVKTPGELGKAQPE